jgi:hypothetical protein
MEPLGYQMWLTFHNAPMTTTSPIWRPHIQDNCRKALRASSRVAIKWPTCQILNEVNVIAVWKWGQPFEIHVGYGGCQKALEKKMTATSRWSIRVIDQTLICINWLVIMIGPLLTFKCSKSVYYPILIDYCLRRGKHFTLNLNVINIAPNTMQPWNPS